MILADATNEFAGQWLFITIAAVLSLVAIFSVVGYFATSRELAATASALDDLAKSVRRQNEINEDRAADLHSRINPLSDRVSKCEGTLNAFEMGFEKFTRIIESNARVNNETLNAFTRSLDTFATVVERSARERSKS
jgi:biopolymer transport protein ExbB/TolQ